MATTATDTSPSQDEYTIIRIKRKRGEEAEEIPDVLVVDDKGTKRRKAGLNVFQFAETIDETAWREMKQEELRNRISALSKLDPRSSEVDTEEADTASVTSNKRQRNNRTGRQYRVIPQGPQSERQSSRLYPMPPKVLSSKDVEKTSPRIRIYDAELAPPEPAAEEDPEMEKFQTLLQDYLRMHDDLPEPERTNTKSSDEFKARTSISPSMPGDYVYDIFYHLPLTSSEQANAGNMATLTGLPFDEDDDMDSESENEDEADEDSNAEDYYKNDYPDEDSTGSKSEGSDFWSEDEWDGWRHFETAI